MSRRGFVIVGGAGVAAVAGALLHGRLSGGAGSSHGGTTGDNSDSTAGSTGSLLAYDGFFVATLDSYLELGKPWMTCINSGETDGCATSVVGARELFEGNVDGCFAIRCVDGSTILICITMSADDDIPADLARMMKEVASWTNLRKVRFAEVYEAGGDEWYALGQRDDGAFVSTWDELDDGIASDSHDSWSGITDFIVKDHSTAGEVIRADGSRQSFDVPQGSFRDYGGTWPDRPALAFPTNGNGSGIILMRDGTCWSRFEEHDPRGAAIRSWKDIVQCVDGGFVYAAISSDGTVHATPNALGSDRDYESCSQCAEELSSWSGIKKLDCRYGNCLGLTFDGNVLYGEFDYEDDPLLFKTYDLGVSGIADAALCGNKILTIDEYGTVRLATTARLTS